MPAENHLADVARRIDEINDRTEAELLALCANPDNYRIAQALTDAMIGNLKYLCNFRYLVDGGGTRCGIAEVSEKLEEHIRQTFKQLTGQEYFSPICRHRLNLGPDGMGSGSCPACGRAY